MKKKFYIVKEVLSWILLVAMVCVMVFTVHSSMEARKTGEPFFLLGHRPILVLTGSMEPYMLTNGLCLTREVTSIDQLEVGDVVTYHVENAKGKLIRITHRIIALDNGLIYTKGDNNDVADGYPLTIDNIESEVVGVFNGTAWLVQKWQTTSGKVMIIAFALGIILLCYSLKSWKQSLKKPEEDESAEKGEQPAEDPEQKTEEPSQAAETNTEVENNQDVQDSK